MFHGDMEITFYGHVSIPTTKWPRFCDMAADMGADIRLVTTDRIQ